MIIVVALLISLALLTAYALGAVAAEMRDDR